MRTSTSSGPSRHAFTRPGLGRGARRSAQEIASEPPAASAPLVEVTLNHDDGVYHEGELLGVTINANVEVFIYCVYHQANGDAILPFPHRTAGNRVKAGTQIRPLSGESVRIWPCCSVQNRCKCSAQPGRWPNSTASRTAGNRHSQSADGACRAPCEKIVAAGVRFQEDRFELDTRPATREAGAGRKEF